MKVLDTDWFGETLQEEECVIDRLLAPEESLPHPWLPF